MMDNVTANTPEENVLHLTQPPTPSNDQFNLMFSCIHADLLTGVFIWPAKQDISRYGNTFFLEFFSNTLHLRFKLFHEFCLETPGDGRIGRWTRIFNSVNDV